MKKKAFVYSIILMFLLVLTGCKEEKYTVAFDGKGYEEFSDVVAEYGSKIENPGTIERTGYTFVGWSYKKEVWLFDKYHVYEDLTLDATWKPILYTINYELNGGKNSSTNPNQYTIENGVTLLPAKKDGYTFVGWYQDPGFATPFVEIAIGSMGQQSVYAKWEVADININYELDGGENNTNNPATFTAETEVTFANPTKEGYEFVEWCSDKNLTKKIEKIEIGTVKAVTVYAKWKSLDFTYEIINDVENIKTITGLSELGKTKAELVIPKTTVNIAANAFENCTNLTKITIQQGLKKFGVDVFKGCTNLKIYVDFREVDVPNAWIENWNCNLEVTYLAE